MIYEQITTISPKKGKRKRKNNMFEAKRSSYL